MLKELERIFGFRTSETTNVELYLKRMDEMGKLDDLKQNKIIAVLINKIIELESKVSYLEDVDKLDTPAVVVKSVETKDFTQDISTIKADITRIKKKVYPQAQQPAKG